MISPESDPIGIEIVETLAEMGFDYIELSLAGLMALPEAAFADAARRIEFSGIRCEACNNFFPAPVRLTGAAASLPAAVEYALAAMDRAAHLGVRVIVFGSSAAKNVPAGFDQGTAWKQIVELLATLGPPAEVRGITIAIEPLNRKESNIVNLASEGLRLIREVNHPNVQLLVDYYHLMMEREDPAIIAEAGASLRHLHLARVEGRAFPLQPDEGFSRFFQCVRQIGYAGRCSVEAYTHDFAADAHQALRMLREAIRRP